MRIRERFALLALSISGIFVSGCYTMQPVRNVAPETGAAVALDVNDAGRVALAPSMGQEIDQIRGSLVRQDSDAYIVAVTAVDFLHGGSQTWTGEQIPIKTSYVRGYYSQAFSPQRTAIAGAIIVVAAAVMTQQGLNAGSQPVESGQTQPPPDTKQRSRPGLKIPLQPAKTAHALHYLWSILAPRL
jgi:hypothetical protein